MKKYIFIGMGGAIGAILRCVIKNVKIHTFIGGFPINTFIINLSGAFVLALLFTTAYEIWHFNDDIRLGIGTGFIGAYTTFSTMCKETVMLMDQKMYVLAMAYIITSVLFGLLFAYFGAIVSRKIVARLFNSRKEEEKVS
ncbi:fluoride efflux transporter CrcB [Clostridium felsineum]|uniref:Fluoride-specific ion channel FluC n=1 Tax=Clostridium felsineum TaxID=36839 RepID=A0A1S8LB80_9CLOT|nr:fluoride efflux transporter CrcB [Clostridium felsineum]MCR3760628.1 fluoride efflux transporter CrcB [Clostridium felsineum]URZ00451.1 Putative fluoride ion transporter CrcB [Clostridium felsineum]URZ06910.1 Putative fluoride ion transporter CrcB [Clostridium felsineum]URZ11942.1 Putative fluoride ion transporter CrcB [Clostridium felsineum]URZ16477.1 Putative fluoride ion transporter CrcB [Clostridium felsineum DSM 794]